ncbi:MAG: alpha/beta fold hydrolase [Halolamina sp.]
MATTQSPATDEPLPADVPGERRFLDVGDVTLHAVVAGPSEGELALLLHGFPEFWYGWHRQVRPLVEAGYRVVVPDQRGYNRSDKPDDVGAYHVDELVDDAVGLVDAFGRETAHVVGHDWGGAVGWWTALERPDRVDSFVAVNIPHPTVMYRTLRSDWDQRLRSLYMLGFQLPTIPERLSRLGDWAPVVRGMRDSSTPEAFTEDDFERYRQAWDRPGAFTGMLNWYRAMVRSRARPDARRVTVPTRVVWGVEDEFLGRSMAADSVEFCADATLSTVEDATHWVHHERPDRVADEILAHLDG